MTFVNAILACDNQGGIGLNNELPWEHSGADMKWFRENTANDIVVMGRKTWESIGFHPLPKRINVVISTQEFGGPDLIVSGDVGEIIEGIKEKYPNKDIWFIGGANVYEQAHTYCDNIYLTQFEESYKCDAFVDVKEMLRGRYESFSKVIDNMKFSVWSK